VVPLQVGDVVVAQQRPQHPVGVGAHQVGVDVDHLRLHPQPEVEAEPVDPLDERRQPVGPHHGIDGPVTESAAVVAAAAEPAVVKHEPLHAHIGRGPREVGEALEVMVEVDRLPRVHQHLAVGAGGGATQEVVDPGGDPVEPGVGPGSDEPRREVRRPRRQLDLAGCQQLAAAEQAVSLRRPLGVRRVVSAPRDVQRPHLAGAEAETGRAGAEQQGRVVTGTAVAASALPGPDRPGVALRRPLGDPAAGQVEQLGGPRRHRQRAADRDDQQPVGAVVDDPGP